LLAVLTAAFLLFQQAIILAPVATAQTSRATTSNKTTVSSGVRKSPAPTLDDTVPNAPSTTIVISQVYGGAGCGTAGCSTYKNDYIELFNRGTSPQSLNGWSVQYAAATGTAWQVTNLTNVTLQPGQYYLVGEGAGANGVNNIPAADVTGTIAMSATAAKIALANTTTALSGQCGNGAATTLPASVIDFVGYGTTANCNDAGATTGGAGNAPAPSTTNADIRAAAGCTDTDNNSTDFAAAAASPRNTATALNSCSVPTPTPTPGVTLSINDVSQDEGNAGTTSFTFTVSLSAPAQTGGVSFTVNTADGTTNPANAGSDYVAIVNGAGSIPEGSSSTQVTVQVNGDGTSEPNETFFVNLTNLTGASFAAGGEQGVGTIVNDDFTLRPIHDIQGSSTASPYAGQTVTTTGIVTLLRTGTNNGGAANSFFIQEPSPDADPNTSEGLLVFTNSVPTVAVGDSVRVTGAVTEFFNMTEISPTPTNVTVLSTGNTLPTPVTLDSTILDPTAPPAQPQLEKYEGMRMTAPSVVTVAPSDTFYEVETVLAGVERPVREPGMEISLPSVPPDPGEATPDCCIPRWDENPERIKLDTNGRAGAPLNGYTSNVTFSTVTGPLDFSFSEYKVVLEQTPTVLVLMPTITAPLPAPDEFTVASYNIENFNNNATQRQKAAQTVRGILHYPDIIGTIEIFDLADLQALRDQINNDAVAAGDPNPQYEAYLVEANGTSEDSDQDVGYLVKSSRVTVNSVTQEREEETYQVPGGGTATLHDRPPFVLDATVDPSGANPQRVIVIVNHLRSFICIEADADPAVAAGCTNGAADGPRVREKRRRQGESLAGLLQELQSNNPGVPVISVGDYNAFQFTDGFTNPVATVKGIATVDNELAVDASPDLVNPDFVNLIDTLPVLDRYSFVFEGTPQALDHHIVNAAARARNTRTGIARVNADFPEAPAALYANNPARVERNSDHDPVVSYYRLGAAQAAGSLVISEFRFRGPGSIDEASPVSGGDGGGPAAPGSSQDNDEFVELYNNTDNDIVVSTLDGSAGWAVVAADGVTRFIIPNDTVIPARGHFLGVNTDGYSLGFYGPPDSVLLPSDTSSTVSGYALDIPDGSGIALFGTADPANYTLANRLDAAGYSTVDPLYREGAGFPAPGAEATSDLEYSFVRKVCVTAGAGCGAGLPKDTADNSSDFVVVNTEAAPTTFGAKLGAPGPEGLTSPVNGNATMPATLLDPSVSASQPPNRVRSFGMHPSGNGTFGTLSIRRTITNNTGAPVRYLAFRIIDITTAPMPPTGTADVRALDSYDPGNEPLQVTVNGEPVDVYGTYVEQPPFQPHGGGLNSSMAVGFIDVNNQLENGDSISVQFLLGIMQTGNYRFYVNIEMINDGLVPEAPAVLKRRKLRMDTQRQQQQERQRPRRVTR
jgi:predicted extracellular nuclease